MALDTSIIVNAMVANLPDAPTTDQLTAINDFAAAMKDFVMSATVVYDGAALLAPSGGGPVTEAAPTVSGITLS